MVRKVKKDLERDEGHSVCVPQMLVFIFLTVIFANYLRARKNKQKIRHYYQSIT